MRTLLFTSLGCFSLMAGASAQTLSHDTLSAVNFTVAQTLNQEPGNAVQPISSADLKAYQHTDAARLLQDRSPVFIKQYGPGQLASSSFRGGGAAHTALLWNGLPINDPLNGQLDLSLLPVGFFDEISLHLGGSSALWGSGAVGGSIHFNNTPNFHQKLKLSARHTSGSFGFQNQLFGAEGSRGRWAASLRINRIRLRNDFPFHNPLFPEAPSQKMPPLHLQQNGLQAHLARRLGKTAVMRLSYWGQTTERNLQPTVFQWPQTAQQTDVAHRFSLNMEGQQGPFLWLVRSGYFFTNLTFTDSITQLQSEARTHTYLNQTQVAIKKKFWEAQLGLHHQSQWANFSSFDGFEVQHRQPSQHQWALFLAPQYNGLDGRLQIRVTARQAFFDGQPIPFQWSGSGHFQLNPTIKIRALAATVYRVPTLNDRFWVPGGQPDLKPEQGHNFEAGIDAHHTPKNGQFQLNGQVNIFSRNVTHWIMWLPNGGFWTPQNLDRVWSRGLEWQAAITKKWGAYQTDLQINAQYILSTSAQTDLQLIYVPMYAGNLRWSHRYKNFSCDVFQQYTGYRYTASDHSSYLSPFSLTHLQVAYEIEKTRFSTQVFFRINNLWNQQFYAVAYRPMPGRFLELGLHFSFETQTKSK